MKTKPKKTASAVKPKPAKKKIREDVNQTAARIVREATQKLE
jgi:hypothetical protein